MCSGTEQEARIALLEHYTSQLQSYKTSILALFVGSFAGIEALRILELPHWSFVFWFCLGGGFLSGCLFYFVMRALSFGTAASCLLRAVPDTTIRYDLLNQLNYGVANVVKAEIDLRKIARSDKKNGNKSIWHDFLESQWDDLIQLACEEKGTRLTEVSVLFGFAALFLLSGLFLLGFVMSM